ncbi:WD40 repeat domain-containing protein [Micromonospora sp. NPDC003241]
MRGSFGVHRDAVTCLAWLADGTHVVTGSADATARIWAVDLDLAAMTEAARHRVFRQLTADERRAHLMPVTDG